ncbi:ArsR/SmtB family transcription factor [Ornithinimicrobium cerasi]|uniref:ArsR/SmtB family transcription factor n=1 Tax=Ornithinimicrobium cerasi TaxID=2248773 RepID=UPI000EFF48BB|nr:metalloregulator ArsR/SmtB family transcription factor [Ornithinimicrobium cerasi]
MNASPLSTDSPSATARLAELCCAPLLAEELGAGDADLLARALRTLADPVRLRIVSRIRTSEDGRSTTTALAAHLGLTQPTVSHHLGTLHDAGFLVRERAGRQTWYSVEPDAFEAMQQLLDPAPGRPSA